VNESTVTAQLHRLADDLTPATDPLEQVAGARSRYRRQRRTRVGLTALAAATAAIVVGVPAVIGSTSAAPDRGGVAGPRTAAPTAERTTSADDPAGAAAQARTELDEARAALEAAQAAAAGGATRDDPAALEEATAALEATLAAQLADVADALGTPPHLSAQVGAPLRCPAGTGLVDVLGGPPVLEQGAAGSGAECRWVDANSGASASLGLIAGTFELYAGGDGVTGGCRSLPLTGGAALQRCVDATQLTWVLYAPDGAAPDAAGVSTAGTWRLTVTDALDQPHLDPASTLAALVGLAGASWGR